jgi:hypothetical protein
MFIQEMLAKVNTSKGKVSKGKDSINRLDLTIILRQYFLKILLIIKGY